MGKAKAWLDEKAQAEGWNKANKLEGRNTTQGLIGLQATKCGTAAAMVELNRYHYIGLSVNTVDIIHVAH